MRVVVIGQVTGAAELLAEIAEYAAILFGLPAAAGSSRERSGEALRRS